MEEAEVIPIPNERNLILGKFDIGEWRYKELKAFCRQYAEKKAKADALLGIQASSHVVEYHTKSGKVEGTVMPSARGGNSDPVAMTASRREKLLRDVDVIDKCALSVDGGRWARVLILTICYGAPYDKMEPELLPTTNRNAYFKARR